MTLEELKQRAAERRAYNRKYFFGSEELDEAEADLDAAIATAEENLITLLHTDKMRTKAEEQRDEARALCDQLAMAVEAARELGLGGGNVEEALTAYEARGWKS